MSFAICILQSITFLDLLGIGLIIPLLSSHVRTLGGSHIQVGLLGSIYAGFQLCSGPVIGSLSDLKGRKPILIITLLICSMAYTYLGIAESVIVILVIRAVLGIFKQTQILSRALVPEYEKNQKLQSEIYGRMAAISGAGITLGPIIGGHISEDYPEYGFPFIGLLVGILFVTNAGLVYFLPKSNQIIKRQRLNTPSSGNIFQEAFNSLKQSFMVLYTIQWSKYWDVFLYKGLVGFTMGVYYSNYTLHLKTQYELTPKYIGYIISFQGIIGSFSSFFIGFINSFYKHDDDYSQRNFHIFVMMSVSLVGMIVSYNIYLYVFWLAPLAVANAMGRLITLEMLLKRCGQHRGTLIGASNSVRSLSGVVSPMIAGFIGQFVGISYVIYASLFSSLIGLILSYQYIHKRLKVD